MNDEELFGHAGSDWQPCHLFTDAEKAEDEHFRQVMSEKKKAE